MSAGNVLVLIVMLALLTACQTTGDMKAVSPPPVWVNGNPSTSGMICAVGATGRTFYQEDAKKYAAENARKELARTIRTEIKTILVDVVTGRGSYFDEDSFISASIQATETIIEKSMIVDYWYDESGSTSHQKGVTYALSCMPEKFNREAVEKRLESDGKTPTDINRQATGIIMDLLEQGEL